MCEMVNQKTAAGSAQAQAQDGYSAPGTVPTALNLMSTVPAVQTEMIQQHNTGFLQDHTAIDHASGMRHNKTGQYRTNELKDVPQTGPAGIFLNTINTGLGLFSLHQNAKCTANDELSGHDRYQCGVGAAADIAGLTPNVPAQMFSTAVGLQQYGAGDIDKQTDNIAQHGRDVRDGMLGLFGDNFIGRPVSELGGMATVFGSSAVHGIGNYLNAGYKLLSSTAETTSDVMKWGLDNARPATIGEAVERANSGCLTHASHKAGVYLDGMGLDRQGQHKPMNGLQMDQGTNRNPFDALTPERSESAEQDGAALNKEQQDMLLKYLMGDSSKSTPTPGQ